MKAKKIIKWVVAFDTLCTGMDCVKDGEGEPYLYDSEEEAQADIQDDIESGCSEEGDDFAIPFSDYEEGHKTIWTPSNEVQS